MFKSRGAVIVGVDLHKHLRRRFSETLIREICCDVGSWVNEGEPCRFGLVWSLEIAMREDGIF